MFVDTEQLLRQLSLVNTVIMVESGLRSPADMQGGIDVVLAPLHNLAQLIPIIDFLKGQKLHRCASNNHSIVAFALHLIEGLIKGIQMGLGRVLRNMSGGLKKLDIYLQGAVAQQAQQLGFCFYLSRH